MSTSASLKWVMPHTDLGQTCFKFRANKLWKTCSRTRIIMSNKFAQGNVSAENNQHLFRSWNFFRGLGEELIVFFSWFTIQRLGSFQTGDKGSNFQSKQLFFVWIGSPAWRQKPNVLKLFAVVFFSPPWPSKLLHPIDALLSDIFSYSDFNDVNFDWMWS